MVPFGYCYRFVLLSILHYMLSPHGTSAKHSKSSSLEKIHSPLEKLLAHTGYNALSSPWLGPGNPPLNVTANLHLRHLKLDPVKMELNSDIILRAMWTDRRLSWDPVIYPEFGSYINIKDTHHLWVPDLFFGNEKTAHLHQIMTPNVFVRIYPDGDIFMSSRISMITFCPLDFHWFPFDNQSCSIELGSYGLTNTEINLQWSKDDSTPFTEAVTYTPKGATGKYTLQNIAVGEEKAVITHTGTYTNLIVHLGFRRESYASFIWRYFLPTSILVCLSWLAFWIPPTKITARLVLGLANLLAICHLQISAGLEPSNAASATAFDIWGFFCTLVVVVSLVESVIINYLSMRRTCTLPNGTEDVLQHQTSFAPLLEPDRSWTQKMNTQHGPFLDRILAVILPSVFFVVSAIFFGLCL